jgi:hypothetical protein
MLGSCAHSSPMDVSGVYPHPTDIHVHVPVWLPYGMESNINLGGFRTSPCVGCLAFIEICLLALFMSLS